MIEAVDLAEGERDRGEAAADLGGKINGADPRQIGTTGKAEKFFDQDRTGQISLIREEKLAFWRTSMEPLRRQAFRSRRTTSAVGRYRLLMQSRSQPISPSGLCERDSRVIISRALEQVVGIMIALDEALADP